MADDNIHEIVQSAVRLKNEKILDYIDSRFYPEIGNILTQDRQKIREEIVDLEDSIQELKRPKANGTTDLARIENMDKTLRELNNTQNFLKVAANYIYGRINTQKVAKFCTTFTLTGDRVHVCDPAYELPKTRRGLNDHKKRNIALWNFPARKGKWHCTLTFWDDAKTKPSGLFVCHEDYLIGAPKEEPTVEVVSVDSGQLGVWDASKYPSDENEFKYENKTSFYRKASKTAISNKLSCHIIDDMGCVSMTSGGDGEHNVYVHSDGDKAYAFDIAFDEISDNEEE